MQNKINTVIQRKRLRKKLLFLVLPVLFFAFTGEVAHAGSVLGWLAENTVGLAFKALLYGVFEFVGLFTSIAVTLFAYVVDPQYISGDSGLLNLQAVYDMWKFVRDFINIFFILGLLFIAFAFVFQIDSYSNSKSIIKLVIAALLVNFSFPIARLIIDLANIPMYFFLQMIVGDNGGTAVALSSSLSASNLDQILLPNSLRNTDVSTILAAIVFLFIFNITIFVFAFQFLIRLIALIILVILSPIGFVAGGIPGLKKYGSQWWDNFLKYCFFGPAAIFMLLLATNFFAAISSTSSGSPYGGVSKLASSTSADSGMIASMVLFFIPITMLWFAMGISSKFSIAGASVATKYGKDFAKWAGKKAASPVTTRYQGIKKGVSKGLQKGNLLGFKYGEKIPGGKYITGQYLDDRKAQTEAFYAVAISGGSKGIKNEREKALRKQVEAKIKENKENSVSWSQMLQDLNSQDGVTRQAAAVGLADSGGIQSTAVMYKAMDAIKDSKGNFDPEYFSKIVDKAKGDSFDDVSNDDYSGDYANIRNNTGMYLQDDKGFYINKKGERISSKTVTELAQDSNNDERLRVEEQRVASDALETFQSKIKKEGEIMVRVNFDAKQFETAGLSKSEAMTKAIDKHIKGLNADDLAKQGSLFKAIGKNSEEQINNPELVQYLKEKASTDNAFYVESMKKMKQSGRQAFYDAEIMQKPNTSSAPSTGGQSARVEAKMSRREEALKEARDKRAK